VSVGAVVAAERSPTVDVAVEELKVFQNVHKAVEVLQ
jgi:hypothetical protein